MPPMTIRHNLACCGVAEISGLRRYSTPENAMRSFAKVAQAKRGVLFTDFLGMTHYTNQRGRAFVMFSGVEQAAYHTKFASLIRRAKLGTVTTLAPRDNPNSGNMLKVYLWAPDWMRIEAWAKENPR